MHTKFVDGQIEVVGRGLFPAQTAYENELALGDLLGTGWSRITMEFRVNGDDRCWVERNDLPPAEYELHDPFFGYFDNKIDELTELGRATYGKKRGFWRR
ncbi:MAG: hypothetical protein QM638_10440 [Nocardioides sp.]|uniref:hypothetical protein n=1 Tax=Nocardioides sp. TaxID=35761 RepID=UPI0039E5F1D2